ncbi:Ig-like domain-containing protein [Brevundimonas subvibrioides]|uniref:Ig-like domain-containing protein n=1 Tax=Brevundimonas subvibrioides TaxID=74313 RepID=UPI0022B59887|nr:Ig-like domain-containing protein [Brevundimonas subvibrioides]
MTATRVVCSLVSVVLGLCSWAVALPADAQTATTYTYDALGRLTRRVTGTEATNYTFDPAGNRVTLTSSIGPVNRGPTAVNDTASVTAGSTVSIAVRSNDTDPDGDTLTVTAVSGFTKGTATITGTGSATAVSYTANAGQTGTDSFTYTISDGRGGTASATVTVTISAAVADIDPNPLTFQNLTISSNDPSVSGSGSESLITGINQPIVLRIQRFYYTGNLDAGDIDYQVFNASNVLVESGSFDIRGTGTNDHRYREVTVQNGYRVKYSVRASTTTGRRRSTWTMAVWRMTGTPALLSEKGVDVTVDADNNYQVPPNVLMPGEVLYPGQALMSADAQSRLEFRSNGSLIITCNGVDQQTLYSGGGGANLLAMQHDGNLVLYAPGVALWHTVTWGNPGAYLVLQNDGNLVLYSGSTPLWASYTFC